MFKIEVDLNKCTGCGECVEVCPMEVLILNNNKAKPTDEENCIGCESCVQACEQQAITVTETSELHQPIEKNIRR